MPKTPEAAPMNRRPPFKAKGLQQHHSDPKQAPASINAKKTDMHRTKSSPKISAQQEKPSPQIKPLNLDENFPKPNFKDNDNDFEPITSSEHSAPSTPSHARKASLDDALDPQLIPERTPPGTPSPKKQQGFDFPKPQQPQISAKPAASDSPKPAILEPTEPKPERKFHRHDKQKPAKPTASDINPNLPSASSPKTEIPEPIGPKPERKFKRKDKKKPAPVVIPRNPNIASSAPTSPDASPSSSNLSSPDSSPSQTPPKVAPILTHSQSQKDLLKPKAEQVKAEQVKPEQAKAGHKSVSFRDRVYNQKIPSPPTSPNLQGNPKMSPKEEPQAPQAKKPSDDNKPSYKK